MSDQAYAKAQAQQKTSSGSSPKSSLLQRTCACGQHTIAGGECSTCRSEQSTLLRSHRAFGPPSAPVAVPGSTPAQEHGPSFNAAFDRASRFGHDFSRIPIHPPTAGVIQTKLAINKPGDVYEREADQVAEQVMRMTDRGPSVSDADDEDEAKTSLMRKQSSEPQADTGVALSSVPLVVHTVLNSGGGQPLDPATRAFMEPRFGHDFSRVRVHTGAQAAESARAVNALAYTVGRDVVFGAGQYASTTHEGRKLMAHELTHVVQQQRRATLGGPPSVVQRQQSSSALPPDPSTQQTTPGYEEAAHRPSFRVRIVAHASPRWRGARDAADADRRNLELSQQRADAVRSVVEKLLARHLVAGVSVNVDVPVEDQDDTVGVKAEARGSRDTLLEAKGDRSDDAPQRRRVDVIIDSSQFVEGRAGASRPLLTLPTASKFWHVSVNAVAGGSYFVAGSVLDLTLTNDSSGQTMIGHVFALGGGPKANIGASASIWSDPTGFSTDDPVDFKAFDWIPVRYTSAGLSLGLGYGTAYISFFGGDRFGSGAQGIDVGGWSIGASAGAGGSVVAGPLVLDKPYPPTSLPIKDTDETYTLYERTERGEDMHKVLFSTGSAKISDPEVAMLDSFLASVVASKR